MKTFEHLTDSELVKAFQDGESGAMEVLVYKYKDKIFTTIKILVTDHYLAEDMFQEVFIKIIDRIRAGKYNEEGKFLHWATRIAHNLCIDHFRKVKRTPVITTNDDRDLFETLNISPDSADSAMLRSESHSRVRQLIEQLSPEQREIIVLRHYANLSFKEIAEMTNTSINTALGRMRYGLMNMRKTMEAKQVAA